MNVKTLKQRITALINTDNPVGYDQWRLLLGQAEYKEVLDHSSKHRKGNADDENLCWLLDQRRPIALPDGRTQIGMMLGIRVVVTRDPQLLKLERVEQ